MAKSFSVSITGNQNIGGRKTFNEITTFKKGINLQGVLDLGANTTATTQDSSDNSTKLATTAYVKLAVATGGVSLSLDNLSDVVLTGVLSTSHVLKYNGSNWVNTTLTANELPSNIVYLNASNKIADTFLDLSTISSIGGITLSNILIKQNNLSELTNKETARTHLGLGSSAILDVGTNPNNIVQLNSSGILPTVSGANLTNLSTSQISDISLYALNSDLITLSNRVSSTELDISTIQTTISNLSSSSLSDGGTLALKSDLTNYALLNSPTFTGTPKAPTQTDNSNPTSIATTQYVENKFNSLSLGLDGLSNITLTTPTTNQVLKYNGSIWVNSYLSSTSLIDTASIMYKSESLLGIDQQQGRYNLGLGTASTYNIGSSLDHIPLAQNVAILSENKISLSVLPTSVLKTTSSISDLSDVANLSGIANGQILIWQDTEFIKGDLPTSTYTDGDALNAISDALVNGKIIYSYDANTNKITSTLNISSLDLSDVNSLVKTSDLTSYALSSDLITLSNRVSSTELGITSLGNRVSTTELDITGLGNRVSTIENDYALNSDLTTLSNQVSTTELGITSLGNRISTIESDYALNSGLTTLSNRVSTTELDITGLDNRVSSTELDITGLDNRVSSTELDISTIQTTISNLSSSSLSDSGTLALKSDLTSYALLNSPTFIGVPKAPTQTDNSNPTAIATTQYVENAITLAGGITKLSELTDVSISNLNPKDTLFYNNVDNKFANRQITVADISDFGSYALSSDLSTLSNRVSTTELDITGLDNRVSSTELGITSLGNRVSTIENDYALNSDLSTLSNRVSTTELDITGLGNRVSSTELDITGLDNRVSTTELSITSLGNRVSTTELDITGLGNRVSTTELDITGLDNRVSTIEGDYALNSDLNSLDTLVTNINTSLGGLISNTGFWVMGGGITTNFLSTATDFTNALDILDGEIGGMDLNSLLNVSITNVAENEILKYVGSGWVNGSIASTSLSDSTNIVRKNENNTYSGSNTYSGDLIVYNGYSLLLKDIGGLNTKFSVDSVTGNTNISGTLSVTGATTLTTVTATTPNSNENSTRIATTEWVVDYVQANSGGGGGSSTLSGLSDVSISNPTLSQILRYNGSAWANTLMSFNELADTSNVALLGNTNAFTNSISISGSNKTLTIKDSSNSTKLSITTDTGDIATYGDLAIQKTTLVSSLTTVYLYVRYNNFSLGDTESIYIFKTSNSGVTREALQLTLVSDSGTNYLQTDTNFAYYRYKSNNGSAQYLNSSNKPNATIQLNVGDTYYIEGITTYDDGGTPNDIEVFFSTSGTATPTWTSLFPTSLGNQPTPLVKTYQIVLESPITNVTLSTASSITNGTVSGGSSNVTSDTFTVDSATGNTAISGTLSVTGATTLSSATATTPDTGDNSTKIATTSYVQTAISSVSAGYTEITSPTASNYFNASINKKYYISPALSSVVTVYLPQSASVGAYVEIHNFGTANNVTVWVYNTTTERIFSCENTIVTSISASLRSTATTRYHCRKFTYIGAKTISGSSYNYWLEIL